MPRHISIDATQEAACHAHILHRDKPRTPLAHGHVQLLPGLIRSNSRTAGGITTRNFFRTLPPSAYKTPVEGFCVNHSRAYRGDTVCETLAFWLVATTFASTASRDSEGNPADGGGTRVEALKLVGERLGR